MANTKENQRVTLFARISCDTKKMIDDEVIRQKTSQARLVDRILRQYFEEGNDGSNTIATRSTS